ncbi:MAG: energy transducer TonB [Gemmatimonadaceae bacterium]
MLLASTAFHAAMLGFAIKPATQARFSSVPRAVEEVHYLTLSLGANRREHVGKPHRTSRGTLHPLPPLRPPQIGPIDLAFALTLVSALPSLPTPSFPVMVDSLWGDPASDSPFGHPDRAARDAGRSLGIGADSGVFIAATVEKGAVGTNENRKPVYPSDLLNRSVEARFSVFFVVDTTGRIDVTTIEIPPSVHVHFAKAVRDVLVQWHFFPAEVRGRRVRQLIEQPFEFRIVNTRLARLSD